MSELAQLTAAQAAEKIRAGEVSADELWTLYRERAVADDLNAYMWVADEPDAGEGPLAGVPLAVKDLFCVEGVPSYAGSRVLCSRASARKPCTTSRRFCAACSSRASARTSPCSPLSMRPLAASQLMGGS